MIIDFHTHIFPRQKAPDILSKLLNKFDIPNFTDGTLHGLMHSMQQAGIQLALTSRITIHPEPVKAVNNWLLGCRRKNILPMATLHPDQPERETYCRISDYWIASDSKETSIDIDGKKVFKIQNTCLINRTHMKDHHGHHRESPGNLQMFCHSGAFISSR